ncbi:methylecgonone reductase-like [Trifolium pratense]|uniref:methylecgonone reductase-like n=1 Tax=Trifolium pratense TaxID=57577 RepID=UPI001E6931B2|nr:methylecgonone reductase-like [Trifolium pratense]XP_045810873.1 methylecgonone reductase-like [Trifolium pratense]
MEQKAIPEVMLNSGHTMPMFAFGTTALLLPPNDELIPIIIDAIQAGYRHFDTAAMYGSEEALGLAIVQAQNQGLIKNRGDIFITTKLWCTDAHPDLVLPALKNSLQRLGLEYVDLYLIHFPVRLRPNEGIFPKGEGVLPFDMKGTWEAMEECSKLGLTKSIGVSNFGAKKLSELLQNATIPPAVNQVEMNVAWQQGNLRKFCQNKGIHMSAWSPLGANGAIWGSLAVMESPILKDIAITPGKSVPQIALRWVLEQGVTPVVKSFNKIRMRENLHIFNWELSADDLAKIKQIPQRRAGLVREFVSENGPYKTLEDLWDGEL